MRKKILLTLLVVLLISNYLYSFSAYRRGFTGVAESSGINSGLINPAFLCDEKTGISYSHAFEQSDYYSDYIMVLNVNEPDYADIVRVLMVMPFRKSNESKYAMTFSMAKDSVSYYKFSTSVKIQSEKSSYLSFSHNINSNSEYMFDIGYVLELSPKISTGVIINDLFSSEHISRKVKIGASYKLLENTKVMADIHRFQEEQTITLNIGLETTYQGFKLGLGFFEKEFTTGFAFSFGNFALDYSFLSGKMIDLSSDKIIEFKEKSYGPDGNHFLSVSYYW